MAGLNARLFARIITRNREVYLLKIVTLAIAFASSVLIILFSLNEFGYDKLSATPDSIFRILQKNTDQNYSGNRLSVKIPRNIVSRLNKDSGLVVSRVKIMNKVAVTSGDH